MRRSRLSALGALTALVMVATTSGVAPAASSPSATASQAFVSGSPSAIACGGSIDAQVTINGQAGSTGASTNVMLVLDLSGSTGVPPSKLAELKSAAIAAIDALDAADGATDQSIAGNAAGVIDYRGTTATPAAPLGSPYATLVSAVNGLPTPSGGSPHGVGITAASNALSASTSGYAGSMVVISDGIGSASELSGATSASTTAKANGDRILAVGVGTDAIPGNLQSWASQISYYQSGTPGPIDKTKLIADLGAAVAVPVNFPLTETLGATFSAAEVSSTTGTVTPGAGTLVWTGTLTGSQSATLVYRATRNGTNVFAPTNEVVSTMSLAVAGGSATVTPPAHSVMMPSSASMRARCAVAGTLLTSSSTLSAAVSIRRALGNSPSRCATIASLRSKRARSTTSPRTRRLAMRKAARALELTERQPHVAERLGCQHHRLGPAPPRHLAPAATARSSTAAASTFA